VKPYKEPEPIFIRYQVERQLAAMFSPQVVLKSGGYIVINQTEALVAIDVNSGKATREHNIEDTALKTNLEAAEEIARQLRLRDLAGLIVIDFIDMDERRNSRLVERRLKESLRHDRARIQVGRISHFGLLEMSRQRLRPGMLEGSTKPCPMCTGTGIVRSVESVALDILRSIEDRLITDGVVPLVATTAVEVALYILNQKRAHLKDIEARYRIPITVTADEDMHISQFVIERGSEGAVIDGESTVVHMDWAHHRETSAAEAGTTQTHVGGGEADGESRSRRGRRRRRKRYGEVGAEGHRQYLTDREAHEAHEAEGEELPADTSAEEARVSEARSPEAGGEGQQRKGRRRGRRGGRRGRGQRPDRAPSAEEVQGEPREAQGELARNERGRNEVPSNGAPVAAREDRHNGGAREANPHEEARSREVPESSRRETEPVFASEEPAPHPAVSPPAEPEQATGAPRRGWWRR
jgi:ribonuclease E